MSPAAIAGRKVAAQASALAKAPIVAEKRLTQAKILKASKRKLLQGVDAALNSLLIAMKGTHRVVVKSFDDEGKMHIETVRDMKRIDELLLHGEYGTDYMILAGAEPDWRAADAFLNRGLGKPAESMKVDVKHTFSLKALARERDKLPPYVPMPIAGGVVVHEHKDATTPP